MEKGINAKDVNVFNEEIKNFNYFNMQILVMDIQCFMQAQKTGCIACHVE